MVLPPPPGRFKQVRVVERPTPEQRHELTARREPWVLRGGVLDWPLVRALARCDGTAAKMAHLSELFGPRQIAVSAVPTRDGGVLGYAEGTVERNFVEESLPFATFAEQVVAAVAGAGSPVYMQAYSIRGWPELEQRVPLPAFVPPGKESESNLWIGSGSHVVNLHFDQYDNYLCMIAGTKRVTLFPPEVLPDIYMGPIDRGPAGAPSSLVKLLAPDHARYPRFERVLAHGQIAQLEAGDVLCLPPLWWHHVESFGLNVMVNSWVHEIPHRLLSLALSLLVRGILLFDPLQAELRTSLRDRYRAAFDGSPLPAGRVPDGPGAELSRHLRQCAALCRRLPPAWRADLALFFDHLVFRLDGEPLPTLPGEFARSVERLRALA